MEFAIETVLTLLTGTAFEKGLDNTKLLVGHMTGEPADEITFLEGTRVIICKQELLRQYPKLEVWMKSYNPPSLEQDPSEIPNPFLWHRRQKYLLSFLEKVEWDMGSNLVIEPIENMPTPEEYFGLV